MLDRVMSGVAGAMAFWLPVVPVAVLSRGDLAFFVLANTLAVACALGLYGLLTRIGRLRTMRLLPIYMLAGIYLLATPLISTFSAIQGGPGLHSARDLLVLFIISVFPPLTMLLVGDSGMILGLLAITAIFIVAAVRRRTTPRLTTPVSN